MASTTVVDECSLYAATQLEPSPSIRFHQCDDFGLCLGPFGISCTDAYNRLQFVQPLPPSDNGLYRLADEMHAIDRNLVQENSIEDFLNAPSKLKDPVELITEWSSLSDNTTGSTIAAIFFAFARNMVSLTDLLASGNPKRPLYLPEIHRPLLQSLKTSVDQLGAFMDDEQNGYSMPQLLQAIDTEIRGSKFLRNYLWMIDKLLIDCMHSRNPNGCTRALVPFVYSASHIFSTFEIANKVSVTMLGEMKYNFLLSAAQFDPAISEPSGTDTSPWKLAMLSSIFDLEHFIEKPILGIPSEGFTVLEQAGFDSAESWLDSLIETFVSKNMHLAGEAQDISELVEKFTNFFYHVETEIVGLDGSRSPVPAFITSKLCSNGNLTTWLINNIPNISGFSVMRGIVGFFKLCPAQNSMPIRPRVKYMITNFNAARNRGLIADKITLNIHPGNALAATLSIFKYIPSYNLRDYEAIDIVFAGEVEKMEVGEDALSEAGESAQPPTTSPTADLWGVLEAMAVNAETEISPEPSTPPRLRAGSPDSVPDPGLQFPFSPSNSDGEEGGGLSGEREAQDDEIGAEGSDDDYETISTASETTQVSNATAANNDTGSVQNLNKMKWIEMSLTELLDTGNEVTVQRAEDDSESTFPDLASRSDPGQLRSIGRLIALGLLAGDPGDSISYIVESRMRVGKRNFREILFFDSESVETGFYDVFNYPLFDLMLAPDEFFTFLTILREPDIRDRALGTNRGPSRTAHASSNSEEAIDDDEESTIREVDELAVLRDLQILPHEDSDQEVDVYGYDEDDDEEDEDEEDEDAEEFDPEVERNLFRALFGVDLDIEGAEVGNPPNPLTDETPQVEDEDEENWEDVDSDEEESDNE